MRVRGPRPVDRQGGESGGRVIPVYSVPPWIGNPSWGSKTDQTGLPPDGKFLTLAEVHLEDESTQVMTVTVQANTLVKSSQNLLIGGPVTALVEFGTAGGEFRMLVDVYNGIQFSVAASWIRVSVFNEALFNPTSTSQVPVQASASISMLPTSKNQTVTKTILSTVVTGVGLVGLMDTPVPVAGITGNYVIPLNEFTVPMSPQGLFRQIPLFSKSLLLHAALSSSNGPGARTIKFKNPTGNDLSIYTFVTGEKQFDPIPIPAGTTQIVIQNDEVATTQFLIPQFFLDA